MLSLNEFLSRAEEKSGRFTTRSYVSEPGFDELYVRVGPRYLAGKRYEQVIDLARIAATQPGNGAFTALVERLLAAGYCVYVECVTNERLVAKLLRMGFKHAPINEGAPSLYK